MGGLPPRRGLLHSDPLYSVLREGEALESLFGYSPDAAQPWHQGQVGAAMIVTQTPGQMQQQRLCRSATFWRLGTSLSSLESRDRGAAGGRAQREREGPSGVGVTAGYDTCIPAPEFPIRGAGW